MKNLTRSTRLAVVPAVFAALALSACQDEAPSAAPPSPASPTAEQSAAGGESQPSEGSESQPSETATPAPETSQAPSPDNGGGSGGGKCENTLSSAFTKGSVAPKPRGEVQTGSYRSNDAQADISFGAGQVNTAGGDSFYPGDGMQAVIFPVTIKVKSGSYFISTPLAFGLVDGADNSCKRDVLNRVVPRNEAVPIESMKPGDSVTAKVAFAVPAGADLKQYSLIYASDYSSGKAELAWKAE